MKSGELEAWVLRIVDGVKRGAGVEDSHVELKSKWQPAERAARQLAGLCNAARGERVLLIVGLDEKRGPLAFERGDLASWQQTFAACFDDQAPEIAKDLTVTVDGVAIHALLFDTDRAPYVVRVAEDGSKTNRLDVLVREGTSTRSARRHELIRMIDSAVSMPAAEALSVELFYEQEGEPGVVGSVTIYLDPGRNERIVFPFHKTRGELILSKNQSVALDVRDGGTERTVHVAATNSEIILTGPGKIILHLSAMIDMGRRPLARGPLFKLELGSVGDDRPVSLAEHLLFDTPPEGAPGWYSERALRGYTP